MTRVRCVLRFAALDHVEVDTPLDLLTESDLGAALERVQTRLWPVEDPREYRHLADHHRAAAAGMVAIGFGR